MPWREQGSGKLAGFEPLLDHARPSHEQSQRRDLLDGNSRSNRGLSKPNALCAMMTSDSPISASTLSFSFLPLTILAVIRLDGLAVARGHQVASGRRSQGEAGAEGNGIAVINMAVARCEKCGQPVGLRFNYHHSHVPKQETRLMCGAAECKRPIRYVWLSNPEQTQYDRGERVFVLGSGRGTIELK
jgi:hypothetical protein